MDRALSLELLIGAVGYHALLPDPDELQQLLAATEISLFVQEGEIDESLLDTGWYLQAVATARSDLNLYDLPRQRQAHQVSAHIFDLALQTTADDLSSAEHLRLTFAAQVGYLGSDLTPNASALARQAPLPHAPFEWSEPGQMSLEAGVLALALNRSTLTPLLEARLAQLASLRSEMGELALTPFAALEGVIRGTQALMAYLTGGNEEQLIAAQQSFTAAIDTEAAASDVDSRWVAVHLRRIGGELAVTSAWAVLPPSLPSVARAMALGDPPVLSLWPPQLEFLKGPDGQLSPLDPQVRRLVLSFPTSAGKTLLAQVLIAAHVASSAAGDVCVVAPTHSLCRELGRSLDRRLRTLGGELHIADPLGHWQPRPPAARVTVMTPEKLAGLLRSDPSALLAQYSMFVIDEAHLVAAPGRGWRLEETLSLIHHLTVDMPHRILILSAALGNQSHVIQWMTADETTPVAHHTSWRGPRRLNAVYTNPASWVDATEEPPQGKRLARQHVPLQGMIHLQAGDSTEELVFDEPVGTLVLRQNRKGDWIRDSATTTERERLVPIIRHVALSGPVLVVQPTRTEAQSLAKAVADTVETEETTARALVDLARSRLSDAHPLTQVVQKGVAFHHAALPVDIRAEIEDAVRSEQIRILIATSTLIEGVNLPFKTVIVGRRGYHSDDKMVEAIDAPGLLNAVGRAGRAGRETEGWMILAEQSADFTRSMFDPLQRTGDDLDISSTLTTEEALIELNRIENLYRSTQDAIFRHYEPAAAGFLSFVWFVAQALEDLERAATADDVVAVIQRTLAWRQLDLRGRRQLIRTARAAVTAYEAQPRDQRERWSRSGASLPTARTLETVADRTLRRLGAGLTVDLDDLPATLDFMLDDETLETLLGLAENDRRGFKPRRNAPREALIDVNLKALILDWMGGKEIQTLADDHLGDITDESYRSEALAEFSASVFEHHLPWTLGIVVQWVNARIEAAGGDYRLPESLPLAIHYGVNTETALDLMRGGIRSRRLANAVAEHADRRTAHEDRPLRDWLADMTIADWRDSFDASPTELADLLSFARTPGAQVVSSVLEGVAHELNIDTSSFSGSTDAEATLQRQSGILDPAPIQVLTPDGMIGTVRPSDHDEVSMLLSMGVPLKIEVSHRTPGPVATISLASEGRQT